MYDFDSAYIFNMVIHTWVSLSYISSGYVCRINVAIP